MRIGVIYLGRRGAGNTFSLQLTKQLSIKAQVFAVVSQYAENLSCWQSDNLDFLTVRTYQNAFGALCAILDPQTISQTAAHIRAKQPDVLLFPMFYMLNPFVQWYLKDIPGVVIVHDPKSHPDIQGRIFRIFENLSLRQARRCLLLSRVFLPDLQRRGVPAKRIDFMAHGPLNYGDVPPGTLNATGEEPPLLLFFGRITPYKGLGVLLQAYRQLCATRSVRLRIAGSGNLQPYKDLLSEMNGVEVINRWIEEAEIPGLFRDANVVVLPYTSASQSGVIAIAASYGLPVIATRTGGIPEQVRDRETGLLVEPGSVVELLEGMKFLLDSPDRAMEFGMALHNDYESEYSWETGAEQVYNSCRRALEMRSV